MYSCLIYFRRKTNNIESLINGKSIFNDIFREIHFSVIVLEALARSDEIIPVRPIGRLNPLEVCQQVRMVLCNRIIANVSDVWSLHHNKIMYG